MLPSSDVRDMTYREELSHVTLKVYERYAVEVVERFGQQLVEAGNGLDLQLAPGIVGKWDRDRLEQQLRRTDGDRARPVESRAK